MLTLAENTPLDVQIVNLCATWKGISHARRLPWLMMQMLQTLQEHHNDLSLVFPQQVLQLFIQRLSSIVKERHVSLSNRAQTVLCEELASIQDELIEDYHKSRSELVTGHIEQLWGELTQIPELGFGLWMSEVHAYIAVYFAYETFLVHALKVAYPSETRLRVQRLGEFFTRTNNGDMERKYWEDKTIEKARLIRHAVTHNGRKATGDLGSKFKNELTLTKTKEVVIKASDTNWLYQVLKAKATEFSKELLALPTLIP